MFHLEDVLQLKEGEQVKSIARRHVATLVPTLFLALLLIVVPFFLLFPLFSWGIPGVVLFFVAVLIGIVVAVRLLILWDADVLIVTTLRVIDVDQSGLLTRTVSEAAMSAIQDVTWSRKGLIETVFRMGSINIQTAGAATVIGATCIPFPKETYELISELRHVTPGSSGSKDPVGENEHKERLKTISRLLETYSSEELVRIESILKARERVAVTDAFLKRDEPSTS